MKVSGRKYISFSHTNDVLNTYIEPFKELKVDMNGMPFVLFVTPGSKIPLAVLMGRQGLKNASKKIKQIVKLA